MAIATPRTSQQAPEAPAEVPEEERGYRIKISNPYAKQHFIKRLFFHKKMFGGAVDHAVVKAIGEYYVRILRRDPDRLFGWVEIETVNRCNSTCSFCPVNKRDDPRDYKYMSDELFTKIVEELGALDYRGRLALYSNNEPLLDPKIVERSREARQKVPNANIYILTNGTKITTQLAVDLLEAGLDYIKIDNYSDQLKLHRNVLRLVEDFEKPEYHQYTNRIFIVKRLLHEVLSNRGGSAPNKQAALQKETYQHYADSSCAYPFNQLIIRPDGKVSLCCNDALGKATMGDVSKRSLVEVWRNKAFTKLREEITTNGRKNMSICNTCDVFTHDPDVLIQENAIVRTADKMFGLRKRHWK